MNWYEVTTCDDENFFVGRAIVTAEEFERLMGYIGNTNIKTKQNDIEDRNKESVLLYHGKPVMRSDFLNIVKNLDINIKNKEECLSFLLNTREMLIDFLKRNKYPTQKMEISESILSIGELVKLIKNKY